MKKLLLLLIAVTISITLINKNEDYIVVPKESIRFRIIPSSNKAEDLLMKEKVKNEINDVINNIEKAESIEESRNNIESNIKTIESKIESLFQKENYNKSFTINYGMNYFPEKIYKGVKYEAGEYESMVIEIGEKSGDNYWCVLFPPLCLIEAEESEEAEYKFFIGEIIEKFFN